MKWLSLFSGIGGFDLALQNLGHEIIGACEIDEHARSVFARHFPNVRLYNDAREIKPEELPEFDGMCGGFPCQAFSISGQRNGFEDTRGTLFFEIARIAKAKKPKILFLENVTGLLNHARGLTYETMLRTLHELGYDAEWGSFNSRYFVPHQRPRVYIVANLRGFSRPEIFPTRNLEALSANGNVRKVKLKYKQLDISGKGYKSQPDRVYEIVGNMGCLAACRTETKVLIRVGNKIRKLTEIECERLQGFPDKWTEGNAKTHRYTQLGNAVTVPVIEFIASRMTEQGVGQ